MTMTPGPNNVLLAQSGANFGVRRTLRHIVGIRLGTTSLHLAMLAGLGALFEGIPALHQVLKLVAVTYLVWLAYSIGTAPVSQVAAGDARQPLGVVEAAMFQWINPKSWLAVMTLCSAFTLSGDGYWQSAVLMVLVFNLVGFPASFTWVLLGQAIGRFLGSHNRKRAFNLSMAVLLLATLPMIIV
ncbi:LysE family translocator [Shewanella sp. JM162201]|uniref:LysE family translocator n=1 Tax=Shewanella jiangmenensis TaxID=2837387 RepID=A0ABS5V5Y9_9GAMM|nr:LysE family translocator [Shewanella jiangmenensis]MBT1445863.1 LysE family translocator [Shewanella jiangmenensis]